MPRFNSQLRIFTLERSKNAWRYDRGASSANDGEFVIYRHSSSARPAGTTFDSWDACFFAESDLNGFASYAYFKEAPLPYSLRVNISSPVDPSISIDFLFTVPVTYTIASESDLIPGVAQSEDIPASGRSIPPGATAIGRSGAVVVTPSAGLRDNTVDDVDSRSGYLLEGIVTVFRPTVDTETRFEVWAEIEDADQQAGFVVGDGDSPYTGAVTALVRYDARIRPGMFAEYLGVTYTITQVTIVERLRTMQLGLSFAAGSRAD